MSTTKPHHSQEKNAAPSHPAPAAAQQAPAQVPLKWSYPFATGDNKDANDAHSYFEALSNAGDGFFPLGANGIWHGGIHFDSGTGQILKQENGARAIADGKVVAYRLDSKYPVLKYQDNKSAMYSTGFVLVRHELVLPPAQSASNTSGTSGAANAPSAPANGASTSAPAATPPADETLTFFSLYMHLLDWQGYQAAIDASPPSDASNSSNPPAVSPIKCMPFWKGERRYRVSAGATDTQREPGTFDFSLPQSMRGDSPDGDGGLSSPSALSGPGQMSGPTLKWLEPIDFAPGTSWAEKFRLIDQQPPATKQKAKRPAAKGVQVYSKANGGAIGLLPRDSEVQLGAVSEKDKGWAPITKVLKGEPVGVVVGDPLDPRVTTGWVKVDQFDLLVDPQPLDSVVVLDTPYQIEAGAVVGYLGEYQRYHPEAAVLPPTPQRPLMHLEVFAGPDLPAFIKKSQARAKQLPDQKTFLDVPAGTMLVDEAEGKPIDAGLLLKPLAKGSSDGAWVKVQPTRVTMPAPPQQGAPHGHASHSKHPPVKPTEAAEGSPLWVERASAGKTTTATDSIKGWRDFPLQLSNARAPAAGFDEVYSRGELDQLGAAAKAQDDKGVHWWKITVGTQDGVSREGWVREEGHQSVQWHSPWAWPGFDVIDNTSVSVLDSFKRFLYVSELLFDGEKDSFEPSAVSVNGSALITKLEKVVDRLGNNDGKVTARELGQAQRTRWVAQAMSHFVVRYESEWGGDLSKWESLSSLMKERKAIWQGELERIEKLQWWDKVKGVKGFPADPAVYHFHPVGLIENFDVADCNCGGRTVTASQLQQIASGASSRKIDEYVGALNRTLERYGIDSCIARAHFIAQILTESAQFSATLEFGQDVKPYDPWRGRGLIQLTGKDNYLAYEKLSGEDVTSNAVAMSKLERAPHSVLSAGWFYVTHAGLLAPSSADDFIWITRSINGGYNGYSHRLAFLNKAIDALGARGCAKLNREGRYAFEDSKAYSEKRAAFAWGLWNDPGLSKSGMLQKDKLEAAKGYKRYLELDDAAGNPLDRNGKPVDHGWYGIGSDSPVRWYAEKRLKDVQS